MFLHIFLHFLRRIIHLILLTSLSIYIYNFENYLTYMYKNLFFSTHVFQNFKDCLNKLDIMNDTLERLGRPKNYIKLHV